jgi:carbamoyltransferase
VANGKLLKAGIFDDIFIQPAAGDAGGALGAALATTYMYYGQEWQPDGVNDKMQGSYLGPDYSDKEIELMCRKMKADYTHYEQFDELCAEVAKLIAEGYVVGWFQGRMEFGPRALGNRSILGDPRNAEMQKKLNLKIKYREGFRPFAPSVLNEDCKKFFDLDSPSPYMLLVTGVNDNLRVPLPENFDDMSLMEKLYCQRSSVQSITHLDFSARVQTVHKNVSPRYWQLINAFKQRTDHGLVVNTSFNVRGEPPVCSPEDGYRCFMRTEMDYLVIGDYLFQKTRQPEWKDGVKWMEEFKLD